MAAAEDTALRALPGNRPRPHVGAILAMSADGKIGDASRTAARFPSAKDKKHLETQLSQFDGALFGASTLRAYETSLRISDPALLARRLRQGRSPQPVHIVCSGSGQLDPTWRFFSQPIPRWLLTTPLGAQQWNNQDSAQGGFDKILPFIRPPINWPQVMTQFKTLGLRKLLVMGGGELIAALVAADLIDEFWLTLCPLLIGGKTSPTPMDGQGFLADQAPALHLISAKTQGDEVFLHYRRHLPSIDSEIQLP